MPSNRVVTYIDIGLNSVDEYWGQLVVPHVQAFRSEPSSRSVFQAAHSVWHLHDWVWHDRNPGQDSRGSTFNAYREGLLTACPELGWLREVTDAGKHRGLGRLPEVKGAEPRMVGLPPGTVGMVRVGRLMGGGGGGGEKLTFFLVLNDGSMQDVEAVLRAAIEFWRTDLAAKNLPSPFA